MRYELHKATRESTENRVKEAAEAKVNKHKSTHILKELVCP